MCHSFISRLSGIPLVNICHISLMHLSVNGYLGCLHLWATVDNAAMNIGVQIPAETLLSILLDVYPEVELLGCMVIRF